MKVLPDQSIGPALRDNSWRSTYMTVLCILYAYVRYQKTFFPTLSALQLWVTLILGSLIEAVPQNDIFLWLINVTYPLFVWCNNKMNIESKDHDEWCYNRPANHPLVRYSLNKLPHDKINKMICAPSKDSDWPRHPSSLIRVFTVGSMGS